MPDLRKVRQTLHQHRAEILTSLGLKLDSLSSAGRVSEEDQATLTHEEFISVARNRLDHQKLQMLNTALQRLEEGEYGLCLECGEEISAKRLQAIPWAKFCIHCQDLAGGRAPADNEVAPETLALQE